MMKRQWMWLAPALAMLTGTGSAFAQTQTPTPTQTPTQASRPSQPSTTTTGSATATAAVVTDSVNVPVQVRTALRGIPVVNTQQILHKSSLDPTDATASENAGPVRLLNNLDLNTVGVRMDMTATSRATTPGASTSNSPTPTPTPSSSTLSSSSSKSALSKSTSAGATTRNGAAQALDGSNALAHAALEGTAEAVVRLGATNAEIVSVSGRGLASVAEITGTCGSLESASQVSLGTTNLRILGKEIALPENPEPNTEVALSEIPGLVSGTVILNEQAEFGDGATSKIIAVAPMRLLLRLSLAGLGGLADVEVSLAGNSASVDCAPDNEEPPTTEQPPDGTPETPTTPTTPSTPTTPTTPETPTTPTTPATPTTPGTSTTPTPPSA